MAALDTALLWLISHGSSVMDATKAQKNSSSSSSSSSFGGFGAVMLPSTLLWAVRSGSEKVERPFIQSVILSMSEGQKETFAAPGWMAPFLASLTAGIVVYVLRRSGVMAMGSMAVSSAAAAAAGGGRIGRRLSGTAIDADAAAERSGPQHSGGSGIARKKSLGPSSISAYSETVATIFGTKEKASND